MQTNLIVVLRQICVRGGELLIFFYIFEQIKDSERTGGFGCSFINMTFISEIIRGYYFEFKFILKSIQSEKEKSTFLSINEGIVSGIIAIGIGHSQ